MTTIRPDPIRLDPIKLIKTSSERPKTNKNKSENPKRKSYSRSKSVSKRSKSKSKRSKSKSKRSKSKSKRSKSKSKRNNKSKNKRKRSKSKSRNRSKSKNKSKNNKLGNKLTSNSIYQPIKLTKNNRSVQNNQISSRVDYDSIIQERLSPYFGQEQNNRAVPDLGPQILKRLERLSQRTDPSSPFYQVIKENILVRS